MARTIGGAAKQRKSVALINFWRVARVDGETSRKQKRRVRWLRINAILEGANTEPYVHNGSFQEAIRPVLIIAQIFALMPVRGISSKYADDLNFSWLSFRSCYALIVSILFLISSGYMAAFVMQVNFDFDSVETLVFYGSIFAISAAFIQLATKWPAVVLEWQRVESQLPALRTEKERGALAYHIRMIIMIAMGCSLVEHLLSMLSSIYYVNACPVMPNKPIDSYLLINFSMFYHFVEYTTALGILGKVINVLATFAWSFNDIFVMAVSVSLASRFRQLNDYMLSEARLPTSIDYWIQCRINFRNLCKLCNVVDDAISIITLLCFSNNLYFICGKILKSLQKKPSASHTVYFWFSLGYLLIRTLILSLYSASINDESKRPLLIFQHVPRQYWTLELKRFSEEVHMDQVALTGMKFFRLTRGVVISVAGTIVTYELILLQFNKADKLAFACARTMRLLPKFEYKFRRWKKMKKSSLMRKLDVLHASAGKREFLEPSEDYVSRKQTACIENMCTRLRLKSRRQFLYNGTFHEAVGKVLITAQFFAMMPVRGVTAQHPSSLNFSWLHVRTCCCLLFIASTVIDLTLTIYKVLDGDISFNNIKPIIFRGCILLVCVTALNLARKWPELMMHWHEIEQDLPQYQTQRDKGRMAHTIHMVMFVGMMLSLSEHVLSMISAINYSAFCNTTADPIKNFFLLTNDEIFYVLDYSPFLAAWGKLQNVYSTFIWNYMDVFVMIVSIGLASKFRQLNDNLLKFKGLHMPPSFWSERRIQYRNICTLCRRMDNAISLITMVSFSNNLYFICVQLLRSLNEMPSMAHAIYFYFSLIFLIGRTLAVSLYAASVHDESRYSLRYLRCVPKDSWCPETKRFAEEIASDLVALSGMKFFHLTRKLVLSVAGTIVTYELVLIQFHEDQNLWDCDQSGYS
ncbi:hypothetical protein ACLKA7_016611 [Drosophila subpalustris]